MKIEEIQNLIPEPLREQFLACISLKSESERQKFWEKTKLKNSIRSETERAGLEKAWIEGMGILKREVQAISQEIKASKTPV